MAIRTGLYQGTQLKQELKINPRLYQAMDLLYMPLLDLQQHIKQEMLNNPFLDLEEPAVSDEELAPAENEKDEQKEENEIDWEEILLDGFDTGGRRAEYEEREHYEPVTVEARDLYDHLHDQLTLSRLTAREVLIGEEIIGNIDENGYLTCSVEQIRDSLNQWIADDGALDEETGNPMSSIELPEVEAMLTTVQGFEPPRMPAPAAAGHRPAGNARVRARRSVLRSADQPQALRGLQGARHNAEGSPDRRGRDRQAGSEAGSQVRRSGR
jgi:RNA polymerase sigma-54 factor